MAWIFRTDWSGWPGSTFRGFGRAVRRQVRRLLLGQRFITSVERNREAADRLDLALKEMLGR